MVRATAVLRKSYFKEVKESKALFCPYAVGIAGG